MTDEATRARRQCVKEIAAVLRSDLYQRGDDFPDEDPNNSATWWSPGKLSVSYGYDGEQRVWIRCRDTRGNIYAESTDATADWLDAEML